ncbi:MAG TPA: hypothetical protein IAA58_01420 [Candidatus Gallacutalibacter stercoravium]|nr:hypothetical protein [Candidatus Gallacutalibacter stercoravium]
MRELLLNWHFLLLGLGAGLFWITLMRGVLTGQEEWSDFSEAITGLFACGYGLNCLISFIRFGGARIRSVLLQTLVLAVVEGVCLLMLILMDMVMSGMASDLVAVIAVIAVVALFLRKPTRMEAVFGSISRLREMEKDDSISESQKKAYARELADAITREDMLGKDTDDIDDIDRRYGR